MEKTVVDWFEQFRGLDAVQAGEAIFSELRNRREHDAGLMRGVAQSGYERLRVCGVKLTHEPHSTRRKSLL